MRECECKRTQASGDQVAAVDLSDGRFARRFWRQRAFANTRWRRRRARRVAGCSQCRADKESARLYAKMLKSPLRAAFYFQKLFRTFLAVSKFYAIILSGKLQKQSNIELLMSRSNDAAASEGSIADSESSRDVNHRIWFAGESLDTLNY